MPRFSTEELLVAQETLSRFLAALEQGDDQAVAGLLYPGTLRSIPAGPGGIVRRFLAAWGVSDDELRRFGIVSTARVLDDEIVAFGILEKDPSSFGAIQIIDQPTAAWALGLITDGEGGWQVWGTPSADEFANPLERVSLPPPSFGPMH
jgi:hypothetical protein